MTSFEMSAPIVWADDYEPASGFSKLAMAIGRMLGGLLVDGARFKFDGTDFSLAALQLILMEAGSDLFVMGAGYSVDENSSFVAMSDQSVWRFECWAQDGRIHVSARVAEDEEIGRDCKQAVVMHGDVKRAALKVLAQNGFFTEGDSWQGHVVVDGHAAICMRPFAYGILLISDKSGIDKSGWKFGIDSVRNATEEQAIAGMVFHQLTEEEVAEAKRRYRELQVTTVEGNPFPQKIGVA